MSGEMDWTLTWTSLANAASITDTNANTSAAVSHDGKLGTEVAIEVLYSATFDEGVKVYICREDGDGDYEVPADNGGYDSPWGFEVPGAASQTGRKIFTVPPTIPRFKVVAVNNSGGTVTYSADYRQAVAAT